MHAPGIITGSIWLDLVGGARVQYHDAGAWPTRSIEAGDSGPAVVLLHGTGGHAEAFSRNVTALASGGYRVYSIDLLGHGYTAKPDDSRYLIGDYVEHLVKFLDAVTDSPAFLVGESLGAWVAMRAALAHPGRVRAIANVVGGGLRPVPPTQAELTGWAALRDRGLAAISTPSWDTWRSRMEWLVNDPGSMTDELIAVRQRIYQQPDMQRAAAAIYDSLQEMLLGQLPGAIGPAEIGRIPVPVLYLWTGHNPTSPAAVAQAAHRLTPDSEFVLFAESGHWPQFEEAARFNDVCLDFLGRH
jgi:2-hydroxy-6-oxonona-2,4-dienedioate hydrolase/2-hydroxy-6-oxo-6-(2'-carboxyphenyl)-hexa-2,4-dienoate hydrolase